MKNGICYILGACDVTHTIQPTKGDFTIAADAGLNHLDRMGIVPDLILGDFDSYGKVPQRENVITFPTAKDDTDTLLAVKVGLDRGYTAFVILGGIGGRLDHTIANIQILAYIANHNAHGYLIGNSEYITVIKNSHRTFPTSANGTISIFAIGNYAREVTLSGLKFPLNDVCVSADFPIGISNEFTGNIASVTVGDGLLALVRNVKVDISHLIANIGNGELV